MKGKQVKGMSFLKVLTTILSCETILQLTVAENLFFAFKMRFGIAEDDGLTEALACLLNAKRELLTT